MLAPRDRLRHWRDFRKTLTERKTEEEQLVEVSNYWLDYAMMDQFLNPDDPKSWPTPWEIVNQGHVCPVGAPYMMEQTLIMSDEKRWKPERLELMYVDDKQISAMFMVLVVDAKYVLNYSRNELKYFDMVQKNCIIHNKYNPSNNCRHRLI